MRDMTADLKSGHGRRGRILLGLIPQSFFHYMASSNVPRMRVEPGNEDVWKIYSVHRKRTEPRIATQSKMVKLG